MIKTLNLFMMMLAGAALATLPATPAGAQGNSSFGLGAPASVKDLPRGPFRSDLEALTPSARARALAKLQGTSFPAADLDSMRVDNLGGVLYVDPAAPAAGDESAAALPEPIVEAEVFTLHSKPGAATVLYIDFDGHDLIDTVWNGYSGQPILNMNPFDLDGNPASFSATEINRMAESWRRVAEEMAPWDIDVTTEEPPFTISGSGRIVYGSNVGHALVTQQRDANGFYVYTQGGCGCGGVAYLGVFGNSYYQPGLTFNSGSGSNAMTIAHEFGHNLNLSHDGTSTSGYYSGHGSGETGWGPTMGAPFGKSVVTWSRASYPDANNDQDDHAIISGYLPRRTDDHADAILSNATPLVVTGGVNVVSTPRTTDPAWSSLANKGIIEDPSDYDLFSMSVGAGNISLSVLAANTQTFEGSLVGAGLNIQARLLDSGGTVLQTSDPFSQLGASISYAVTSAGTYYLEVTGVGKAADASDDGFADYCSIGQYYINGTIPEDVVIVDPPIAPSDLTASLIGENSIELSWTDPAVAATANETGYRVFRSVNGAGYGLIATLAQDSSFYSDNNLSSGEYSYYLEVFNAAGTDATASTGSIVIDVPRFAVATAESTSSGSIASGSYLSTQQQAGAETLSEQHSGGRRNRRVSSLIHDWSVTGVTPGSSVTLDVIASAPSNGEGDDFRFTFSVNGGPAQELGTVVAGTGQTELTASLPGTTSGTVTVGVEDTDRTAGAGGTDTLSVSLIRVSSAGDPAEQAPVVTIDSPADGTTVTGGTEIVLTGTATDYEDGALSTSIAWSSDVDGPLGTGASAAVVLSGGTPPVTHQITATVTDSAGLSGSATIAVNVDDTPVATSMSVADLDGSSSLNGNGKRWQASVAVRVTDDLGNPVGGATVFGSWNGDASGTGSCQTDGSGNCSISNGGLRNNSGSATFSVTNIAGSLSYDAAGNSDPDGDSDGTTIAVSVF
jgi:hypothetical protein